MEGKYRFRTGPVEFMGRPVPKEYWDARKENPSRAKELLGGNGFSTKKNPDTWTWEIVAQGDRIEHDNPADYYNTCLKIAKKRAHVDGTLSATGASDMFTQDVEDMPEVIPQEEKNGKPEVQHPKEKTAHTPTEPAKPSPEKNPQGKQGILEGDAISEPQRKRLYAIAMNAGMTKEIFQEWLMYNYNIDNSKEITKSQYEEICNAAGEYRVSDVQ